MSLVREMYATSSPCQMLFKKWIPALSPLLFTEQLWNRCQLHFIDEKMEAHLPKVFLLVNGIMLGSNQLDSKAHVSSVIPHCFFHINYVTLVAACCPKLSVRIQASWWQGLCFVQPVYFQSFEQYLEHPKCSVNTCWIHSELVIFYAGWANEGILPVCSSKPSLVLPESELFPFLLPFITILLERRVFTASSFSLPLIHTLTLKPLLLTSLLEATCGFVLFADPRVHYQPNPHQPLCRIRSCWLLVLLTLVSDSEIEFLLILQPPSSLLFPGSIFRYLSFLSLYSLLWYSDGSHSHLCLMIHCFFHKYTEC